MIKKTILMKNGSSCIIRSAVAEDADEMLVYVEQIARETDFLLFGPGELDFSTSQERMFIESFRDAENKLLLAAVHDNRIVGVLNCTGGDKPRVRHAAEMGISVLKRFWGQGIGTALMDEMFTWARSLGIITKINLSVREDNERAIRLYKKQGFSEEGLIRRFFCVDGVYFGAYHMGCEL